VVAIEAGARGSTPVEPVRLTRSQLSYCRARAEGCTGKEAAQRAGVSEQAAWKWFRQPARAAALNAAIDDLQAGVVEEVKRRFRAKALRAAERVAECMEPGRGGMSGDLNLKAALAVLRFAGAEPADRPGGGATVNVDATVNVGVGVKVYLDPVMGRSSRCSR
jgi:hypothetical protein